MNTKITIRALLTIACLIFSHTVYAYIIDGYIDDWGVDLTAAGACNLGYLNTSDPAGELDVNFIREDNTSKHNGWRRVGPGFSYKNYYDAEALYFDNDAVNAYVAIVTGLRKEGPPIVSAERYLPGDIGFDINKDGIYEYGLDVREYDVANKKAKLYKNLTTADWKPVLYFPEANPWEVKSGSDFDWVDFVYSGEQNTHYVLEAGIPLSSFGLQANDKKDLAVHWTMQCGNDVLHLNADINPVVPEPGTLMLFGSGIFGMFVPFLRKFFRQIKGGIDICMAIVGLIITAPLWVVIGLAIKLTSPGPIFFKQERIGEDKRFEQRRANSRSASDRRRKRAFGQVFHILKFRTMYVNAEKNTGAVWAKDNDPRITPVGKLLRKTHLDELPQLCNVLRGEMSIIGPRPERQEIAEQLIKQIKKYKKRLRAKPGITGLAQVRQHYDETLADVKKKVHYDLLYIRKMCLLMDMRIMWGTFIVMLTGKGAK